MFANYQLLLFTISITVDSLLVSSMVNTGYCRKYIVTSLCCVIT